jgi:hypothetical protein
MPSSWLALSDALAAVTKIIGNEAAARKQILQKLKWGELRARAESGQHRFLVLSQGLMPHRYLLGSRAYPRLCRIESDWWTTCEIDWKKNTANARWSSSDMERAKSAEKKADPFQIVIAGVHVFSDDFARIWQNSIPAKRGHRPKGTGLGARDAALVEKMHARLKDGTATSPTGAARAILKEIPSTSGGSPDSQTSRLVRRYKKKYARGE